MAEPGTYEHRVELFDNLSEGTKKRLVRDSRDQWHTLEQSDYVFGAFDLLVGLKTDEDGQAFRPKFDRSREIVDEAVDESNRSGLPLDLCFQSIVLKRDHERISELVRKEDEGGK